MCKSDLLKALKDPEEEYVWGKNVPSEDLDDRSFIQYWEDNVHYEFDYADYLCPATHQLCKRDELDGAYVKIVNKDDDTIYITPLHQSFNRSESNMSFQVKRVTALEQRPSKKTNNYHSCEILLQTTSA